VQATLSKHELQTRQALLKARRSCLLKAHNSADPPNPFQIEQVKLKETEAQLDRQYAAHTALLTTKIRLDEEHEQVKVRCDAGTQPQPAQFKSIALTRTALCRQRRTICGNSSQQSVVLRESQLRASCLGLSSPDWFTLMTRLSLAFMSAQ
jgi:hypothetical protein